MTIWAEIKHTHRRREPRFQRNPDVRERRIDDAIFLVNTEDDTIYYLNPLSAGIWHLLARPASRAHTVQVVQEAFPDIPAEEIASDIAGLMADLEKHRLVLRSQSSPLPGAPSRQGLE
jgi:hypothetical protein